MQHVEAVQLMRRFSIEHGTIDGAPLVTRRLSDLHGVFADQASYRALLEHDDPVIYTVASIETAQGDGQLHYGLGTLMPGRVGAEYFCTKGHLHAWRPAAEVYIGLSGVGAMLLEDEQTGVSRLEPLGAGQIVYVPGFTAHRTMNIGNTPLIYIGVYPAAAGHDYGAIAIRNFRNVVVEHNGLPTLLSREAFLTMLTNET